MADKRADELHRKNPDEVDPEDQKREKRPEPFRSWAVRRYGGQESERGQLARAIDADPDFPDSMDRNQLALYIYNRTGVPKERLPIFNYMYNQYKKKVLDKAPPELVPAERKKGLVIQSIEKNCAATDEEVSQITMNALYWYTRPLVETAEECAERLNEFFSRMAETGEIPTVEKMALALGTYTGMLNDWTSGRAKVDPAIVSLIKKGKQILAALDAELVSRGKIPVVSYIFRAKNFFGMRDQQEIVQANYNIGANPADLARLYGEIGQDGAGAVEGEMQE